MIAERTHLTFDVLRLRAELDRLRARLPPIMRGSFGGWSMTSSSGRYQDGWERSAFFALVDGVWQLDRARVRAAVKGSVADHAVPTDACTGYFADVLWTIAAAGLNPRRARLTVLTANGASHRHQDYPDNLYAVRLHIPIITNATCHFVCEEGSAHLPADGSAYLLRVNRVHQIFNRGREDRFHLMMDVWDTRGVSKLHRYPYADVRWRDYPL